MSPAITQSVASGFDKPMLDSIKTQLKWSIPAILGAILMSAYYFLSKANIFAESLIVVALLLPVVNSMNVYNSYLTGKKDFKRFFTFNNIFNVIYLISMLATISVSQNPFYLILTYFISNALLNTYLYFKAIKEIPPNNKEDSGNLEYSKHLSFINILNVIAIRFDSILIFHYLGATDLAIYNFAKIIPDKITGLFKSVINIALPKLTEKSHKDIKTNIHKQITQLVLISLICSIIFILIAPTFYRIFFPKYESSIMYAQIYSLSLIMLAAYLPSMVLISKKAIKEMYVINIINPVMQIALLFLSIIYFGLLGIIVAKILNQFVSLITYWTAANNKLNKEDALAS